MMKPRTNANTATHRRARRGATAVETAIVLPIFGMLIAGMVELSHAYMVQNTLTAAAKQGARLASMDDVTNSDVTNRINDILAGAYDTSALVILVKDASVYDDPDPTTDLSEISFVDLNDVDVTDLERRDLFLVNVSIPYDEVSLFTPVWAGNINLTAVAVMRHE